MMTTQPQWGAYPERGRAHTHTHTSTLRTLLWRLPCNQNSWGGGHVSDNLAWNLHTSSLVRKANQVKESPSEPICPHFLLQGTVDTVQEGSHWGGREGSSEDHWGHGANHH